MSVMPALFKFGSGVVLVSSPHSLSMTAALVSENSEQLEDVINSLITMPQDHFDGKALEHKIESLLEVSDFDALERFVIINVMPDGRTLEEVVVFARTESDMKEFQNKIEQAVERLNAMSSKVSSTSEQLRAMSERGGATLH